AVDDLADRLEPRRRRCAGRQSAAAPPGPARGGSDMAAEAGLARARLPRRAADRVAVIHQSITSDEVAHNPRAADGHAVRMLRPDALTATDHARWADLSAATPGANIFAEPWFMDAALR